MTESVLLMDVGGTNTRIKILAAAENMVSNPEIIAAKSSGISDKKSLLEFISTFISEIRLEGRIRMAVLSFAGIVSDQCISMTNWPGSHDFSPSELIQAGLDAEHKILVNDMEAAAHCLIAHHKGKLCLEMHTLYAGEDQSSRKNNNSILIIPGTGVGVAGLTEEYLASDTGNIVSVSCEVQHTGIPVPAEKYLQLFTAMKNKTGKTSLSWEDLVSGRGLENIYSCLSNAECGKNTLMSVVSAAEIAERAVKGTDTVCMAALEIFYRCAGSLAQTVALSFQAFGGIFLAGESTRKNASFLESSPFLEGLHDNEIRGDLLRLFPVYVVARDMNLDGAAYMADRYLYPEWRISCAG